MTKIFFFLFAFCAIIYSSLESFETSDKWIVVTTIQYPTKALKKIASIPGWHVVIVGDKKTPTDWHLENCEYLSVEMQQDLGYEIIKFLPWNHYCRKNIGYLYAISNGAKIIYETDDDNELIGDQLCFPTEEEIVILDSSRNIVNVYAYFGRSGLWPRGYPLNQIHNSNDFVVKKPYWPFRIGVVQGLVNKEPDMDAIYRLTQGSEIYFEYKSPCLINSETFSPFNTQNTLFNYNAFWGLYIPSASPFRVCDIWRSYIVQKLLWDLDLSLCFTAPTAIQERNAHDCFRDFCDEQELYLFSGLLIDFLLEWEDASLNFEDRFQNLIRALVENNFLKNQEIDFVRAWINDLKKVGYQFPSLKLKNTQF